MSPSKNLKSAKGSKGATTRSKGRSRVHDQTTSSSMRQKAAITYVRLPDPKPAEKVSKVEFERMKNRIFELEKEALKNSKLLLDEKEKNRKLKVRIEERGEELLKLAGELEGLQDKMVILQKDRNVLLQKKNDLQDKDL